MRGSRRLKVWLPDPLDQELVAFAQAHGLSLAAAIRATSRLGLEARQLQGEQMNNPAALAALLAAEHAVLMVASVLPEGERRMRELGQRAAIAAEERLAQFTAEREAGQ